MDALPVNALTEIFLRLPAKVLIRFKRVCKLWKEIIDDPYFNRVHVDHSFATNTNLHFLVKTTLLHLADFDTFDNLVELNYPFKSPVYYGGVEVVCANRGLFLLWKYDYDLTMIVYNPTNQTHKTLPFLGRPDHISGVHARVYLGFGYDKKSDDYKCVRIFQKLKLGIFESQVMVYSLKADSWRRPPDLPYPFRNKKSSGVVLEDNLHWIGENGYKMLGSVVAFSLKDETFSSLALPEFASIPSSTATQVGVLGERLCLMAEYSEQTDVWGMREYGVVESWELMFRIRKNCYRDHLERLISFSGSREKLYIKRSFNRVALIDLKSMSSMDVKVADLNRCLDLYVCVDNLLMLGGTPDVQAKKKVRQSAEKKKNELEVKRANRCKRRRANKV